MPRLALPVASTFAALALTAGGGCYLAVDKSNDPPPNTNCVDCLDPISGPVSGAGGFGSYYPTAGSAGAGGRSPADNPLPPAVSPPACSTVSVSRFNELLIVDPQVTNDPRASNESAYRPWSFRARLESLVPDAPGSAGAIAAAWLGQWDSMTSVPVSTDPGAETVSIQPRPAADSVLLCPWLIQSNNGCDSTCTTCSSRNPNLGLSPFRLLAIVNRADSASAAACGGDGGQLRFIYGAADPFSTSVLPFTVAFEYAVTLKPGETLRDWAAQWHALGGLLLESTAFNDKLDSVLAQGLARATLQRVVTNEVAFGSADGLPWEMRQFVPQLTDAGTIRLVEVAVTGTPRLTLASSAELGQWIDANSSSVLAGQNPLPASMLAASAPIPTADFAWHTTASDATTAAAFNRNTCNGCHGGRTDAKDVPFQHVAPPNTVAFYGAGIGAPSAARLSLFLNNPGHDDELGRREKLLAGYLCAACSAPAGTGGLGGAGGAGGSVGSGGYAGRSGTGGSGGAGGRPIVTGAGGSAGAGAPATGGTPGAAGAAGAPGTGGYTAG